MIHIPILRQGKPYKSIDVNRAFHYRTGEQLAEISQANIGLIRRDLFKQGEMQAALQGFTTRELIALAKKAAKHFAEDELPLGDSMQSPDDIVKQITGTTGSPNVMVRRNMEKVRDPSEKVERMFLTIMNRKPTMNEKEIAKRTLGAGEDGYANMIWALINTREFMFVQYSQKTANPIFRSNYL
jgi:hypothetical protein